MTPSPSQPQPTSSSTSSSTCVHRWRLGRPVDGVCLGVCVHCGATRSYPAGFTATRAGATVIIPRG